MRTIFIDGSIIVVASGNEQARRIPTKICSSMVLKNKWNLHLTHCNTINIAPTNKNEEKSTYHIIIKERTIILYESNNWKCQIFGRPIRNWTTKLSIPVLQEKQLLSSFQSVWIDIQYCHTNAKDYIHYMYQPVQTSVHILGLYGLLGTKPSQ